MGLFSKFFGFRWSLYVQNGNQISYAMHENSVLRIVGYVIRYFANGASPVDPWSLYLNFNHTNRTILLRPEHFTPSENVTSLLIEEIQAIDPGWKTKGGEPVFEEASTKKRLRITEHDTGGIDVQAMLNNIGKHREATFYSVMDEVFGDVNITANER
jgi:hypothetical protein